MKAVILAAGQGLRIREHHNLPKGLIELGGQAIIKRSISLLKQHGIDDILLVTGYNQEHYQTLSASLGVSTLFNPHFADYASLYSLYTAKDWIDDDCLILESDIAYEARAISTLLQSTEADATLVSGQTNSSDEVYVEAQNNHLINMSKQYADIDASHCIGEFVGISKLSLKAYQSFLSLAEQDQTLLHNGCYEEHGLTRLSQQFPITCIKIENLIWCEIDDLSHLNRAKNLYNKICEQDQAPTIKE